jgi:hypothetical protein
MVDFESFAQGLSDCGKRGRVGAWKSKKDGRNVWQ